MNFLEKLLGVGQHSPQANLNSSAQAVQHPALNQSQIQAYNAHIESDGAKAYNQAHPGQVYQANQNNEFTSAQLPAYLRGSGIGLPIGSRPAIPKTQNVSFAPRLLTNFSPNVNLQNQSYIPIQGSQGFGFTGNLQNAYHN